MPKLFVNGQPIKGISEANLKGPCFRASLQPDGTLELLVYEDIGENWWDGSGVTAKSVKEKIDQAGPFSKVLMRINSPGGDAFEGMAIYNLIRSLGKPVETCVDGIAASAASIIAMCGDEITMGHNAMMMIHNAWSFAMGDAAGLRKVADTLEKISASLAQTYVDKTGKSMDEIKAMMDAETWMSAEECVAGGFATCIAELPDEKTEAAAMAMARKFKALDRMKRVPERLKKAAVTCECECVACADSDCANCSMEGCEDSNCVDCPMQMESEKASNLSLYEAQNEMRKRGIPLSA